MALTDDTTPIALLRERLRDFARARDWGQFHTPKDLSMAIAVEAGELMELYLWRERDADLAAPPDPERRRRIAEEAADVAICLLNFCNALDLDLATAIEAKIAINEANYPVDRARGRFGRER